MAINIIKNEYYVDSDGIKRNKAWHEYNMTVEHLTSNSMRLNCDTEYVVTEDLPPGVYQIFDLTQYDCYLSLDISFSLLSTVSNQKVGVNILKLDSYTVDPINGQTVFKLYDTYRKSKAFSHGVWTSYIPSQIEQAKMNSVRIEPGLYVFGITTWVDNVNLENDPDESYQTYTLEETEVRSVAVHLTELEIIDFQDILVNGHFESIDAPFDKWFYRDLEVSNFENDPDLCCPVSLDSYNKRIKLLENPSPSPDLRYQRGLSQIVTVDYNCTGMVSFWGRYDSHKIMPADIYNDQYFTLAIHKLSYYYSEDSYDVDCTIYSNKHLIEHMYGATDAPRTCYWQYFKSDVLELEKGSSYIITIIPPDDTINDDVYAYVDNVSFNIVSRVSYNRESPFINPYTTREGFFYYVHDDCISPLLYPRCTSVCFMLYDGAFPTSGSHIYNDGKYYLTNGDNGKIYYGKDDIYDTEVGQRYIYADGHMSINESFVYNGATYNSNYYGEISSSEVNSKVNKIEAYRLENGEITSLIDAIDMFPEDTFTFRAVFDKQYPSITLTVTSSNYSVVKVNTVDPGSDIVSNTSNDITIKAVSYGDAIINISCKNTNGTTISYSFLVRVRNELEYQYPELITLTMDTSENYVALDSFLTLKCLVKPLLSSQIPIDWHSSNERIAKVDYYGNVRPISLGTCVIRAINPHTNKFSDCTLHVVERTVEPEIVKVYYDSNIVESITIGLAETTRLTAKAMYQTNKTRYVKQEFVWSVLDSKIATVDQFGFIRGVKKGTTTVICSYAENSEINASIKVTVTGEYNALINIELNLYEFYLNRNDPYSCEYLIPTFIPSTTSETDVSWIVSHPDIIKVGENGQVSFVNKSQFSKPDPVDITIKCVSTINPSVSRTCIAKVVDEQDYHPSIQLETKKVEILKGSEAFVKCEISYGYNSLLKHYINITKPDGSITNRCIASFVEDNKISIIAYDGGEYIMTVYCEYKYGISDSNVNISSESCEITVFDSDTPPIFIKPLEVICGLQNGSAILRFFAEDDMDKDLSYRLFLNNNLVFNNSNNERIIDTVYNGERYYYIFLEKIPEGDHNVYLEAISDGYDENYEYYTQITQSNPVLLTIPIVVDKKTGLHEAKQLYDIAKEDVVDYMTTVVQDSKVYINEKEEFECRYEVFCCHYYNLENILEVCVEYINSQIAAEQASMSTIATALASDGTSVATYSEGDYTNSNYENISDMDYYQNECIKQLVARILQLEARLDELTNN